ncbi:MAG: ABC transporter substrate-binding protein [Rubrimonas sp.]|uniref:ABC transporter substrate-binding protein n=1 Tax=Rubrimonas sp. TaxID=2036015 RepID=UPI002FDEE966
MTRSTTDALIEALAAGARAGRVSRRGFMEGALFAGASVAGASALWGSKVAAQTPQRGGTFRVGLHNANTGDSLDPGTTDSVYMIQLNHAFRSYLTEIAPDGRAVPDLATAWEASSGAREWRFEIAQGATFHSGKPLRVRDVIASLDYHRAEDSASAAKALMAEIEDIRADGDSAIVIALSVGNADLPYLLSDYHLVIGPADEAGNVDWEGGDGTGPYRILRHEPGVGTSLARHDGWHREGAWFEALELIALNDANARQSALLTGDVDAISEADAKTLALMARNPGVSVVEVASGAHTTLPMFADTAPFDNLDVRLALKYAIDRQEIVDKIVFGRGSLGNDTPIAPTLPFHHPIPQRPYDPERASFHLRKAGAEGLSVRLHVSDVVFTGAVDLAVLYREQAAKAGIDIEVVREPIDGYWSDVWLKKPFCVVEWGARPTPDVMFSLAYRAGAPWNESRWENARFNELLLLAKPETDEGKRAAMYAEMQQLVHDDGATVIPYFRNRVNVFSSRIGHPEKMAGNWELDGARSFQRWWFKA